MSRVELHIFPVGNATGTTAGGVRCVVNKWKFQDKMMGEQFITFNITSEKPIDWSVGDYCIFRDETFTLNYVPTVIQKARTGERQDSYTYENVKFESRFEELTRCTMLDIIPTSALHQAVLGTNYTGSSKFQLYCGETVIASGSAAGTYTPVCALALKMQANLDRMYGSGVWTIDVDTTTSYTNASGNTQLVTHTDEKILSFDNTTVAKALEEVHNTFKLDYCVKGRTILIGHTLKNLTSDNDSNAFAFGYGKGYPTRDDMGTGLFQLKRVANSQQKIVTRLRAIGSTKNMPYRHYHSRYSLSQAMFPTNLQLPNTFDEPETKAAANTERDELYGVNELNNLPYVRHVKGDTNDAYIDKNDDAEGCVEGIREDSVRFDGSNSDLPEIYPTIEEVTYGDLRGNRVQDQAGISDPQSSFDGYDNDERVDELLAIGYQSGGVMIDDANKGNGILTEDGLSLVGTIRKAAILDEQTVFLNELTSDGAGKRFSPEKTIFTIPDVYPGEYMLSPTHGATFFCLQVFNTANKMGVYFGFRVNVKQKSARTGEITTIASYISGKRRITDSMLISLSEDWDEVLYYGQQTAEIEMPSIPDVEHDTQAQNITVTEFSEIIVSVSVFFTTRGNTDNINAAEGFYTKYWVGRSIIDKNIIGDPGYSWSPVFSDSGEDGSWFHVFIKDMGFDLSAQFTSEDPVLAMKSGGCVGREFKIGKDVSKVTYNGKKGYMLSLQRKTDDSINTYYPSATDQIAAGDRFVLLNINMPNAYIEAAESRLLRAATDYLADNCETKFTYQPSIDDIYLQRNYDICCKANHKEDSIFWRLYAGLKFTFIARFSSGNDEVGDELMTAELTIEQVSIQMGDGLTPKVEIRLNDDVQQSTLQKLTTSIDRIYSGSIFGAGSGGGGGVSTAQLLSLIQDEGSKQFISKRHDDIARGVIGFLSGLWVSAKGLFGFDEEGNVTASSLKATGTSGNTVTDADNSTQKNLGLEVSESGLIGGILRVAKSVLTKTVQSLNFTGGDSMFGTGWQLTDNDGNGNSRLVVDNLIVRMKAVYNELEVRKLVTMAGNYVFSPAASIIEEVDYIGLDENDNEVVLGYEYVKVPWVLRLIPISLIGKMLSRKKMVRSSVEDIDFSEVVKYRCWLRSDDGTTQTINTWRVGMLARCQTFNVNTGGGGEHSETYFSNMNNSVTAQGNKLYWRAVTGIGTAKDRTNYNLDNHILEDGLKHNYIDLANYTDDNDVQLFLINSDRPETFDHIVCYGDWLERSLSNLISIETVGSQAPVIREMLGVGYTDGTSIDWSLTGKERTRISPVAGNKFVAPSFVVTTDPNGTEGQELYNENSIGTALRYDNISGQTTQMATNGSIILLVYSDIKTDYALKTCRVEEPHINPITGQPQGGGIEWDYSYANLGDAYINQQDGHRYVATATGWEDRGLSDESKSTLKVDINGISAIVASEIGGLSTLLNLSSNQVALTSLVNFLEAAGIHIKGVDKMIELIANRTIFSRPATTAGGSTTPMIAVEMCDENGNVDRENGTIPSIVFYDGEIGEGGCVRWILNYKGFLKAINTGESYDFDAYTLQWLGSHSVAVGMDEESIIHAEAFAQCPFLTGTGQDLDTFYDDDLGEDVTYASAYPKASGTGYRFKSAYHMSLEDVKVYDPANGEYKENRFWDSDEVDGDNNGDWLPTGEDADGFYIIPDSYDKANAEIFQVYEGDLDPELQSGQSHVSPLTQLDFQQMTEFGYLPPSTDFRVANDYQIGTNPVNPGVGDLINVYPHDDKYILLEVKNGYIISRHCFYVHYLTQYNETTGKLQFVVKEWDNGGWKRSSYIIVPQNNEISLQTSLLENNVLISPFVTPTSIISYQDGLIDESEGE